jgi:hypothetical protein
VALKAAESQSSYQGVAFSPNRDQVVSKVDTFLVNLYRELDRPHQEFEKAIRGELLPGRPAERSLATQGDETPSELAPPFSAPNRFDLGDTTAIVGAVESNVENLKKSWSEFGDNLRSQAKKTKLSKEISNDTSEIKRINSQLDALKKQKRERAKIIGVDINNEIERREKEIARLQQDISNNETKLATL